MLSITHTSEYCWNLYRNMPKPLARVALLITFVPLIAVASCGEDSSDEGIRGSGGGSEVFFPKHGYGEVPAAMVVGKLTMDDKGCVRLNTGDPSEKATILWPAGYALNVEGDTIRILDGEGRIAATVGNEIEAGGGFIGTSLEGVSGVDEQTRREAARRCPGEYFYAGSLSFTNR